MNAMLPPFEMRPAIPTATPKLRLFAASIIAHEAELNPPSAAAKPTALPVIKKILPLLANLMGRAGSRAVLSRALTLARVEIPWLTGVEVHADDIMENFAGLAVKQEASEATEGSEVLLAHLLGLLVVFIGEVLTLRLLYGIWPDLPMNDDFTQGNFHE